jgi:hypothetical protein
MDEGSLKINVSYTDIYLTHFSKKTFALRRDLKMVFCFMFCTYSRTLSSFLGSYSHIHDSYEL